MKKVITNVVFIIIMTVISIFSLSYYALKFYPQHESILIWAIIVVTLLLGVYNAYNLSVMKKQNTELFSVILDLAKSNDKQYVDIAELIHNSRDISLDTLEMLKEKEKGTD